MAVDVLTNESAYYSAGNAMSFVVVIDRKVGRMLCTGRSAISHNSATSDIHHGHVNRTRAQLLDSWP